MRSTVGKAISLGLGLAIAGKEQIEKTVDELVKRGEVKKEESKALIDELLRKGDETKEQMEEIVKERVDAILGDSKLVRKKDLIEIERRLAKLEQEKEEEEGAND
ncbi:phasin family protein [Evansella cellulosilytica]|uniref:Polyhydroxyalkanoate synthesis regulator phasin n=1 Tax=Evansella cellulosilytica (strain ATCC 21833 / DSM 2522 / FERM P-1141 / JCM 9156 / N-4) TaxID=649639 RepID=E6TYG2_EVAC2|nr:ATP synthase subunit B [Evansella cellulosilytica]ADU28900.1 hypothetical protein Bcell_0618 [Evansella cellulosilytica DSM 2522]